MYSGSSAELFVFGGHASAGLGKSTSTQTSPEFARKVDREVYIDFPRGEMALCRVRSSAGPARPVERSLQTGAII